MQGIFRNESTFKFFLFSYSFKASNKPMWGQTYDIAVKALGCLHLTSEYMNFSPGPAPGSSTLVLVTCTGVPGSLLQPGAALTIVAPLKAEDGSCIWAPAHTRES